MAASNSASQFGSKQAAADLLATSESKLRGKDLLTVAEYFSNIELAQQWAQIDGITDQNKLKVIKNTVVKAVGKAAEEQARSEGAVPRVWREAFNTRRLANGATPNSRFVDTRRTGEKLPDSPTLTQLAQSQAYKNRNGVTPGVEFYAKLYQLTLTYTSKAEAVAAIEEAFDIRRNSAQNLIMNAKNACLKNDGTMHDWRNLPMPPQVERQRPSYHSRMRHVTNFPVEEEEGKGDRMGRSLRPLPLIEPVDMDEDFELDDLDDPDERDKSFETVKLAEPIAPITADDEKPKRFWIEMQYNLKPSDMIYVSPERINWQSQAPISPPGPRTSTYPDSPIEQPHDTLLQQTLSILRRVADRELGDGPTR